MPSSAISTIIQINSVDITVNNIYDNEDLSWLQESANNYHIKTRQSVILSLLAVRVGDRVSPHQLLEAERLLRNQNYIRDAKLSLSEDGVLKVTVADNWTLFPTASFNRTGGQNSSAIGLRDTNLLGLGIAATINYKKDQQKSGYRFRLTAPTGRTNHSYASLVFEDFDTGSQKALSYVKPFYTSETENSWNAAVKTSDLENTFYQNDEEIGIATASNKKLRLNYGWLTNYQQNIANRTLVGFAYDTSELIEFNSPLLVDLYKVKKRAYLWWGKEQFESHFKELKNIFIIDNKEDINFGLHTRYSIGAGNIEIINYEMVSEFDDDRLNKAKMLKLSSSFAWGNQSGGSLLFHQFNLNAEVFDKNAIDHYYSAGYKLNVFYPFANQFSFYVGNQLSYVSEFRQVPSAVGGEAGLRGYPTSYQWGKRRFLSNFELRYYSKTVLWNTFSIGYVAFTDIGRAWQSSEFENLEKGTLKSVGIGMRIFPKVASGRNVVHIDFARPYSGNAQINDWEWRVQVKNSF